MTTHDLILRDGQDFLTPKQKQLIILNPDVLEWDVNQLPKDDHILLNPYSKSMGNADITSEDWRTFRKAVEEATDSLKNQQG